MEDLSAVLIVLIAVPFLLFIIRIITLFWHNCKLSCHIKTMERQLQTERQQLEQASAATSNDSNNSNDNNNPSIIAKELDLPPAYSEVIQSYMLNKPATQNAEQTGATPSAERNTISAGVSTLTIESDITNSTHNSMNCLNNTAIV